MVDLPSKTLAITDENSLWSALELALSSDGDDAPFEVDFSNSNWAKIHLVYRGDRFHASLTPSAMKGIVELQASLYKSAAAILRDDADVRRLTDLQRDDLELTFTLKGGSADAESDGKGFLAKLAEGVSTMSSRHKLIALLVLGGMYFGGQGFKSYIDDKSSHAEKLKLVELNKTIMAHDERAQELLAKSVQQSAEASKVQQQSSAGFDSVVRNAGNATFIEVQGITLEKEHIDEARATTRRSSRGVDIREQFTILSVDATAEGGFVVHVRSSVTGRAFKAALYDSFASDATRRTIQRAEWKKQKVVLHITGRQLGDEIVDARVIQAKPVNAQPLSIVGGFRKA